MKKQIFKLGTKVKDKPTGLKGTLTMCNIDGAGNTLYVFQPNLLTPTGKPSGIMFINAARISDGKLMEVDLPTEVLGTEVKDKFTGFKGTAIELNYHLNGCVHFDVKPKGVDMTGETISALDLDIRRLEGKSIKKLTKSEEEKSKKKTPSPERMPSKLNR